MIVLKYEIFCYFLTVILDYIAKYYNLAIEDWLTDCLAMKMYDYPLK